VEKWTVWVRPVRGNGNEFAAHELISRAAKAPATANAAIITPKIGITPRINPVVVELMSRRAANGR